MDFPWLTTLAAVPLVGAAVVAALPAGRDLLAKQAAFVISLVPLAMTVAMALKFESGGKEMFQFSEVHEWIPQFGVSYALGIDGIALVLIAMATVLTPVCILASWHDIDGPQQGDRARNAKGYFALLLLLETFMIGVFSATDVFFFYVLFEAMLVPMYFIIGSYGGAQRSYAAVKFLLYSLAGGLLMLAAVIGLYVVSDGGSKAFLFENLLGTDMGTGTERLLFVGFFIAFAIKAPLWPVHTWLPDAAAEAPPGGAVLLVGVLDKVGTFGMIRFCLPLFPDASQWATPVVLTLAVIGILYGALLAIGQTDMKRLIAYTSISHFGFIVLGIFAMTTQGQSGSTLYMVNHGFSTAALFLIAGFLISRRGSRLIADYGGVQKVAPMLAGTFLVAGLSSLALPGLSSFVSEFLVLVGTFTRYEVAAVVATGGIILASLYILLMYQRTMTGEPTEATKGLRDLDVREAWVVGPLIAIIIALGFFPKPLLDVINPAVARTMQQVGVTDPEPVVPADARSVGSGE
jgi:NADH-quinone oxidoreductase subunit M